MLVIKFKREYSMKPYSEKTSSTSDVISYNKNIVYLELQLLQSLLSQFNASPQIHLRNYIYRYRHYFQPVCLATHRVGLTLPIVCNEMINSHDTNITLESNDRELHFMYLTIKLRCNYIVSSPDQSSATLHAYSY